MEIIRGFLELATNDKGEVVLNLPPDAPVDEHGRTHFVFTPEQARSLGRKFLQMADAAETGEDYEDDPLPGLKPEDVLEGNRVVAVFPPGLPMQRGEVSAYYGYTMERDVQAAMLPKPFRRIVFEGPDGEVRVASCAS